MDAIVSAIIVVGLSTMTVVLCDQPPNINDVLLYQQAQDMMEVCSKKFDLSPQCFDFLNQTNPALHYCLNCDSRDSGVTIHRTYADKEITLRVWLKDT